MRGRALIAALAALGPAAVAAAPSSAPTSRPSPPLVGDVGAVEEDWPEIEAKGPAAAAATTPRLVDWRVWGRLLGTIDSRREGPAVAEDVATLTWNFSAEASVAARGGWHFRAGGRLRLHQSWRGSPGAGFHRSDIEVLPAESYLAWQRGGFEGRFGMQTFVWGANDLVGPLDVLAPRDLRQGLLTDPEAARLPIPALSASARLWSLVWSVVWSPVFTPHRIDLFGSDFAVLGPGAPAALRPLGAALEGLLDDTVEGELQRGLVQTRLPRPLVGGDLAVRLERSFGGVDLSACYVYTHQRVPALAVHASALPALTALLALDDVSAAALAPVLAALLDADGGIEARYPRQHVAGISASGLVGPFVASVDVAYRSRQLEPIASGGLLGLPLVGADGGWLATTVESQALSYTIGLRHDRGEELLLALEWWHELLLDELRAEADERLPLLFGGPQRGGLAALLRFSRAELTGQILMHVELFHRSLVVTPELSYRFGDHLTLGAGFNLFVGQRGAGALYQANDQLYAFARVRL